MAYRFPLALAILLTTFLARAGERLALEPYAFEPGGGQGVVDAQRGELEVPARHDDPDGARLTLAFVRFASTSARPRHPIVDLAGGLGGSGIAKARRSWSRTQSTTCSWSATR